MVNGDGLTSVEATFYSCCQPWVSGGVRKGMQPKLFKYARKSSTNEVDSNRKTFAVS